MSVETRPKNITLLVRTWQQAGGLEAVVRDNARTFETLGWHVDVISVFDPRGFEQAGTIAVRGLLPRSRLARALWGRLFWKFAAAGHIRRALASGGLLVCAHAHLLPALDYVEQHPSICRWGWVYGLEAWGGEALRWVPYLKRLDRVVSISEFTTAQLTRAGYSRPVSIVPPSVDLDAFKPSETPEAIRRDEVLICGRMASYERYKGHDVLFRSLPVAEAVLGRRVSLRVVGTGDDQARLVEEARRLGISGRVTFTGRLPLGEVVDAYRHCGVFCMPSRVDRPRTGYWTGEGFGIVYVEAAACGRPVIASSEGGAPETVVPGETGLLVDPRSPASVGNAIAAVLSDPARADDMGRRGRALAETRFSRRRLIEQLQAMSFADGFGDGRAH